jgi:hypothetical protein
MESTLNLLYINYVFSKINYNEIIIQLQNHIACLTFSTKQFCNGNSSSWKFCMYSNGNSY